MDINVKFTALCNPDDIKAVDKDGSVSSNDIVTSVVVRTPKADANAADDWVDLPLGDHITFNTVAGCDAY